MFNFESLQQGLATRFNVPVNETLRVENLTSLVDVEVPPSEPVVLNADAFENFELPVNEEAQGIPSANGNLKCVLDNVFQDIPRSVNAERAVASVRENVQSPLDNIFEDVESVNSNVSQVELGRFADAEAIDRDISRVELGRFEDVEVPAKQADKLPPVNVKPTFADLPITPLYEKKLDLKLIVVDKDKVSNINMEDSLSTDGMVANSETTQQQRSTCRKP